MSNIEERVSKSGDVSYRARVRLKGFKDRSHTFKRKTDARKWVSKAESEMREGRYFGTLESEKQTLADAIERYIKSGFKNKPSSSKRQTAQLQWWHQQIGHLRLSDIKTPVLVELRDKLAEGVTYRKSQRSAATVNRYLAVLSHLFSIAIKEWEWLQLNPVKNVTKLKEPVGRARYLSEDELRRLITECKINTNQSLYVVVVLCLSTGARKSEILSLHWKDIDFNRKSITLEKTKNRERRSIHLSDNAITLLRGCSKLRRINSDQVFPGKIPDKPIDIRKAWEKAVRDAKIENFRFHDLRHTAASYLAMNGASLIDIAKILGHKNTDVTKRYAHLSEQHVAEVTRKMNDGFLADI